MVRLFRIQYQNQYLSFLEVVITVVRELRVHELSQTDLVTLYQLHLLVWENYYIVYVHLIFLRGILLYKIHYKICLSFRATCKVLLKHGKEKEEECSVNIKPY